MTEGAGMTEGAADWIPAYAGMTEWAGMGRRRNYWRRCGIW